MTNKNKCFVGFDTSNYTTSIAVADENGNIIANLKAPLPVKSGERGLRQSDAVFAHVKNLPSLTDELSALLLDYEPVAVGVSVTPRRAEGSYMPCFLCGISAAHSFAAGRSIPIIETSHQHGHIMAAAYSSGHAEMLMKRRNKLLEHDLNELNESRNNENKYDSLKIGQLEFSEQISVDRPRCCAGTEYYKYNRNTHTESLLELFRNSKERTNTGCS